MSASSDSNLSSDQQSHPLQHLTGATAGPTLPPSHPCGNREKNLGFAGLGCAATPIFPYDDSDSRSSHARYPGRRGGWRRAGIASRVTSTFELIKHGLRAPARYALRRRAPLQGPPPCLAAQ